MITGNWETRKIKIDGKILSPMRSQQVWNHSPDGFCWSYGGSGPAQLALALLLEFGVENDIASKNHQTFKFDVIANLPGSDFEIENKVVEDWIEKNIVLEMEEEIGD